MTLAGIPTRTPSRAAVSVDELKRAWAAVQEGQFRHRPAAGSRTRRSAYSGDVASRPAAQDLDVWTPAPGEQVLPVLGCAGSAGTTTVALAVALAAGIPARVVECSSVTASGLAAASNAELGLHDSGWRQGKRDQVLLERASDVLVRVDEVPMPAPASDADPSQLDGGLTVLDIGWELGQLLATPSWLNETVRAAPTVIAVTPATVPGLRRLEGALELLGADHVIAAVIGPRFKKWPKGVAHSAGLNTRRLLERERFVEIPEDRALAVSGLDSTPLPAHLLAASAHLLAQTHVTTGPAPSPTTENA